MQSVLFEVKGDGSHISPRDSVTSQGPGVAGKVALTLGELRGNFECVHIYIGSGAWNKQGKREENGNEHLLSIYHMLVDMFYMLSMNFFQ